MGDIWKGLVRLEPVETATGRIEIAYELGGKARSRATKFLPAWAIYLLDLPEGADALVVVSRGLTMTVFCATRLRCSFAHDEPRESLTMHELAAALHEHLSAGGGLEGLFHRYQELVTGEGVSS